MMGLLSLTKWIIVVTACLSLLACAPGGEGNADPSLEVKSGVENLFADYGFHADMRDTQTVKTFFTSDGVLDVPSVNASVQGPDAIAALFGQAWKAVEESGQQRRHVITGIRIIDYSEGQASFRAIMNVTGKPENNSPQVYMTGVYNGEAVQTDKGWRFKRLQILVD